MKAIVTICSKNKDKSIDNIPAYLRYTSTRIKYVMEIAEKEAIPFFIFSGKYGLIKYDQPIPFYNHLLKNKDVTNLAKLISKQITDNDIDFIDFYAKERIGNWSIYYEVIEQAVKLSDINMKVKLCIN